MTPPAAAAAPAVPRGRTVSPPRPTIAPRKPRRVSGPARQPVRPQQRPAESERGIALGVADALRGLSSSRSLDRLIRGRSWIVLIAFALIGIVTLQLLVLKLNANIGRSLVREGQLQRENAALSIESSELAAGERVESQAGHLGMELVPEGSLRFLSIDPHADIARAAAALSKPVDSSSSSTEAAAGSEASTTPATEASAESSEASAGSSGETAPAAAATTGEAPAGEQGATPSAAASAPATVSSGAEASSTADGATAPAASAPAGAEAGSTGAAEAAAGGTPSATQSNRAG